VTDDNNEHLDAMCAADLGIIYDGQMVSSAAACHLPAMSLIKMRMHHHWYHDLFNRWATDMNIIADNNVYPELIGGEAWFGKIADSLAEWYIKPDTRYKMIRKFDGFV
jgi:lipid A disaccharide synthetase